MLNMEKYIKLTCTSAVCARLAGLLVLLLGFCAHAQDWTYSVRGGDTLWGLCEKYTTVKACWLKIGDYNHVKYPRTLAPGTKIRFPVEWLRDPPAPAEVVFVRGRVTKVDATSDPGSGVRSALKKGDLIGIGMELAVDKKSLVIVRFADQSLMTVESESVVRFDVLSKFSKTGMVDTRLHLHKGAVHTQVPKRSPASRFEISTPSSVAAVRGTNFRVASTQELTRNEVFGGEVQVSNDADAKDLMKGMGLLAKKDQVLPEVVKLLPAPIFTAEPTTIFTAEPTTMPMPHVLDWRDVVGAQKYKIQLIKKDVSQAVAFSAETDISEIAIRDLPEDCYRVLVSAIDADKFQGLPGETQLCLSRQALGRVESPAIESLDAGKIRLSWPAVKSADHYRLVFSHSADFAKVSHSRVLVANTVMYEFDEQQPLYVKISAENKASGNRLHDEKIHHIHTPEESEKEVLGPVLFVLMIIVAFL